MSTCWLAQAFTMKAAGWPRIPILTTSSSSSNHSGKKLPGTHSHTHIYSRYHSESSQRDTFWKLSWELVTCGTEFLFFSATLPTTARINIVVVYS